MKLPTTLLLHVSSVGLLALVGLTVSKMVPHYKPKNQDEAQRAGAEVAKDKLASGRGQGPTSESWNYGGPNAAWWAGFSKVNLIGKLPPPPPKPVDGNEGDNGGPPPAKDVPLRPLAEVIELVSLVCDGKSEGKGGNSHVILRFKPDANVEPPEWWVRENVSTPAAGAGASRPMDGVPPPRGGGNRPASPASAGAARPVGALPVAATNGEKVQRVWVQDDGDPRRSSVLWPIKSTDGREVGKVRLVRVAANAESAFFVRELPPLKAGDPPRLQPEEELIKTSMNIPQEVLAEMRRMQGRPGPAAGGSSGGASLPASNGQWIDQTITSRNGNLWNVGREDEQRFRERSDELFERLDVDTYVSKTSSMRGVYVRNVEPELATKFGVSTGDVLLEVNGRKVESKAQAIQAGKADYNRGVRTFTTKWLTSSGQVVDRTYQAPDR